MYDKKGMLLRIESVINNPYCFKLFRTTEGKPDEKTGNNKTINRIPLSVPQSTVQTGGRPQC